MKEISTSELQNLINSKGAYYLIDIREKDELKYGIIPTSKNIPMSKLEIAVSLDDNSFLKEFGFEKFKKTDNIIVYCRSGRRSLMAAEFLESKGYNVRNYKGSIIEWSKTDPNVKAY